MNLDDPRHDEGEVVHVAEIKDYKPEQWTEMFHQGEIVILKGAKYRVTRWKNSKLYLKLVKGQGPRDI